MTKTIAAIGITAIVESARRVVRDIGWVTQVSPVGPGALSVDLDALGVDIRCAYDSACALLILVDPEGAAEFIKRTYGPAFRNTGRRA